jgi:hypothetical protein
LSERTENQEVRIKALNAELEKVRRDSILKDE